ncbi:MAG TPA: 50S ribosomal protein L11 methyltransferase, partial [Oligoflexia bacterium]|nr:50S ribosomal protein L11 methyltransferase [Oligoflexia bacterium]
MISLDCKLERTLDDDTWDLVSGLLYQFHSQGLEEGATPAPPDDKSMLAGNEFELALEPGILSPPREFKAYFENRRDAERAERAVTPILAAYNPRFCIEEVSVHDYSELWRQSVRPMEVAPNWYIRAPWHPPLSQLNLGRPLNELIVEPGMAFGTGSHETTQSCLTLLSRVLDGGLVSKMHALDFGCGSGILAIALKRLGIEHVTAIDIDPLAIDATHANAALNGVSVTATTSSPDASPAQYDGIVANILRNTL